MSQLIEVPGMGQVEFPDGMRDEDIVAAIKRSQPSAAPPPPVPAPPTYHGTEPQAVNAPLPSKPLQAGIQGAGRGMADLAGLPGDLMYGAGNVLLSGVDMASQKLGGPELSYRLPSPSDTFANVAAGLAEKVGFESRDPADMSWQERGAYNINRFGTQAAVMAPGMALAAAPRAASLIAGKTAPRTGDTLLRPYMGGSTGKTLSGDLAAGAGAGAATSGLQETSYTDNPLAALAAPMIGGVGGVGALAALKGAGRGAAALAGRPFGTHLDKSVMIPDEQGVPTYPRTKATDVASQELHRNMALPPEQATSLLRQNKSAVGDYLPEPPTAFQMSEDPGLLQLDNRMAREGGGKEALRQQRFQSGIYDTIDKSVPPGSSPTELVRRAQQEVDARMAASEGRLGTAEGRVARVEDIRRDRTSLLEAARGQQGPASERLHQNIVDESFIPARTERKASYEAIDPERKIMVDAEPVLAAARNVRDRLNTLAPAVGQQQPNEFMQRLEALAPRMEAQQSPIFDAYGRPIVRDVNVGGSGKAALGGLVEIQPYFAKEIERAAIAGNFKLKTSLEEMASAVRSIIQTAPEGAGAQAVNQRFMQTYRPHRTDEMAKFTKEIDRGERPPPSQTAPRFLRPGQPERSAALNRVIESVPQARGSVDAYLRADLAGSKALNQRTETLDSRAIAAWREKNASNIAVASPEFRAELDQLATQAQKGERVAGTAAERLKGAQAGVKRTQADISKSALGMVLGGNGPPLDPDKIVHAVMGHTNSSKLLLRELIDLTANDLPARDGLKAAVHNYIVDKVETNATEKMLPGDRRGTVSPARISNVMKAHETELRDMYTPDEMNALRVGYEGLALAQGERLRLSSGSDTAEKMNAFNRLQASPLGKAAELWARIHMGVLKTGGVIATARRMMGGEDPVWTEAMRVLDESRKDPEVLITLMGRKAPIGSPAWNAKLNQLLSAGAGARGMNDEDQRKPDVRSR